MNGRYVLTLAALGFFTTSGSCADELTFEKHIRPLFRAHCFDCHGATETLEGRLDLRLVRLMRKGGESGAAIVPGSPDDSYLVARIRSGEMPPGESSLPAEDLALIERWIAAGARTARPEPESIGPGLGITPEERSHWAFQPVRRPEVVVSSAAADSSRVRTPIDVLVLKNALRLRMAEVQTDSGHNAARKIPGQPTEAFGPDADRRTVIKRAYFNLLGLPPTAAAMTHWMNHDSSVWYEELLTELLDSPHYGERWARHWLDVAGYADSEGYTTGDSVRPWAWKYRDWVIRSLNQDKPFDQFLTEQLAGDELAGPRAGDLRPEQIELLTATGFLRMAADGTDSGANTAVARNQVMTDTLKIVGTALLGVSLQCAQCHDHRYDPIPQTDYYALRAVFEPALDWQAWKRPRERQLSLYTEADRKKAAAIEVEVRKISDEKRVKQTEFMKQALEKELMKYAEPLRTQLRDAYQTPGDKRTAEQKQLLAGHPSVNISPGVLYQYLPKAAEELKKYDSQIADARAEKPPEEFLRILTEPDGHVPETKLFYRGDHEQPQQTIAPASLTVASPEGEHQTFALNSDRIPTTGRRLAFAQWLTSGRHPLVARVIVNRIWMHHFGTGLVTTPSDFGKLGTAPSNPELLDWLADEFVRQGWSLKQLHRLIMTSTVWRQSAEPVTGGSSAGQSRLLLRKPLVRLQAEAIRDRMLAASGQLDRALYGPPVEIKEDETGQVIVKGEQTRRSLYVQVRRSRPVAMMKMFDAPVMETNCESRASSTVATQSLMLLNGEFALAQAGKLADRVAGEPQVLNAEQLASLPEMPGSPAPLWRCGYGAYDIENDRTGAFTEFSYWTGNTWQVGSSVPDPKLGFVFLNAAGGHPDASGRAVIRRWTATRDGVISVRGHLNHPSPNGDGVEGLIVSSRSGKVAGWIAAHQGVDTPADGIQVVTGDTIDFITGSRASHTSDSFSWTVTITLTTPGQPVTTASSKDGFRGPAESTETVPGQIVRAWELALCRPPSAEELELACHFVAKQVETFQQKKTQLPDGRQAVRQAMINLCQSLMSSNEFLYVD